MNSMIGVQAFIRYWDSKTQFREPLEKSAFKKQGPLNSINIHGNFFQDSSIVLTRNEEGFYAAIEIGVRELVTLLVEKMNWITYSSCEGHNSYQGVAYKKRIVQLFPRNVHEKENMYQILTKAAGLTNQTIKRQLQNPLSVQIAKESLKSGGTSYETLKIVFENNQCSEGIYFNKLQKTYTDFIQYFNEVTLF